MISPFKPGGEDNSRMGKRPNVCLLLLLASQAQALTATPGGLSVTQSPPTLTVLRGETATLRCHFKAESLRSGVQWFKVKPEKQLIHTSARQTVVEENQTSSLMITEVALEDSGWFYCEVNVLHKDPERGNGTELLVLAPPSPPRIYLRIPPNPQTGQWGLLCVTGGFHPNKLNLTWSYRSGAARKHRLSATSCSLPALDSDGKLPERPADGALLSSDWPVESVPAHQSKCVRVMDKHSREVLLFSAVFLPPKPLDAGITFTCEVRDHPAIAAALSASFTWEASPNELIAHLNILKMCFLCAVAAVLSLEAVKRLCKLKLPPAA